MKKMIFLFSLFSIMLSAQRYLAFPKDQHSYLGGSVGFYKDFHKILIEKNLNPCSGKKEYFVAKILVESESSIKIIVPDSIHENSKCAYGLTREVLNSLDKWIPAKIDGKIQPSVATYFIFPNDLFESYKEGYRIEDHHKMPKYGSEKDSGINKFREEVLRRCDLSGFYFKGKGFLRVQAGFAINSKGELEDLKIIKSSGLKEFDEMILNSIRRSSKNKWSPATIHDIPIKYHFTIPISVDVDKMQ